MRRILVIPAWSAVCIVLVRFPVSSQVPAGPPYESGKHPNPIVTFVTPEDFAPTTYDQARDSAGIDLMGLSAREGTRQEVYVTESRVGRVRILGRDTDVLFYPVVRQDFRLVDGKPFELYSFRDPNPTGIPSELLADVLDRHAFGPSDKPEDARFGDSRGPEQLEIRSSPALLFDEREDSGRLVLFWQDERASHVAVAPVTRERLFSIVADLL